MDYACQFPVVRILCPSKCSLKHCVYICRCVGARTDKFRTLLITTTGWSNVMNNFSRQLHASLTCLSQHSYSSSSLHAFFLSPSTRALFLFLICLLQFMSSSSPLTYLLAMHALFLFTYYLPQHMYILITCLSSTAHTLFPSLTFYHNTHLPLTTHALLLLTYRQLQHMHSLPLFTLISSTTQALFPFTCLI